MRGYRIRWFKRTMLLTYNKLGSVTDFLNAYYILYMYNFSFFSNSIIEYESIISKILNNSFFFKLRSIRFLEHLFNDMEFSILHEKFGLLDINGLNVWYDIKYNGYGAVFLYYLNNGVYLNFIFYFYYLIGCFIKLVLFFINLYLFELKFSIDFFSGVTFDFGLNFKVILLYELGSVFLGKFLNFQFFMFFLIKYF